MHPPEHPAAVDREDFLHTRRDRDAWRAAHRELAALLGATDRGRDHCDALLVITAIKHMFRISEIRVTADASEVHITTEGGDVHHVLNVQEEIT